MQTPSFEQYIDAQSVPSTQSDPSSQGEQEPPQSTSVSSPLRSPSSQVGSGVPVSASDPVVPLVDDSSEPLVAEAPVVVWVVGSGVVVELASPPVDVPPWLPPLAVAPSSQPIAGVRRARERSRRTRRLCTARRYQPVRVASMSVQWIHRTVSF